MKSKYGVLVFEASHTELFLLFFLILRIFEIEHIQLRERKRKRERERGRPIQRDRDLPVVCVC